MANDEHLDILKQGVVVWNRWRKENPDVVPDLYGADLNKANLLGPKLQGAKLQGANLSAADFRLANLQEANLIEADLSAADLSGANLNKANLQRANLRGANLIGAYLGWTDLSEADLSEADLQEANLSGADLFLAELRGANLSGAWLPNANLQEANLIGADLHDPAEKRPEFSILPTTNLNKADLSYADLSGANLQGAILGDADLNKANLQGANLQGAYLLGANLSVADLREANLRGANLIGADLSEADLSGANLSRTTIGHTVFVDVDLSSLWGLETIQHDAPSPVSIGTLYKSGGKIPEVFLRGCGVPDSLIEHLPLLIGAMQPNQFYSCFISHSTRDEEFAKRLHGRMQQEHLRVWFAPEDIKGGKKIHEQLEEAIRIYDKLLVVLSEHSLHSKWVMTEIRKARKAELHDNKRKLFPIRLAAMDAVREWECFDADTGEDLAVEVREYHIPDFSNWKDHDDAFEAAFARLLRDLKAVDALPVPAPASMQPAPTVPPASIRAHLQDLITTKTRRVQHLEQQQAFKGANTSVEVLMELEDMRRELAELEHKLTGDDGSIAT